MKIVQVPVLEDNYAYLVIDEKNKVAAAVDPAGAKEVLAAAKRENVTIVSVLTTHHHWDHAGGNGEVAEEVSRTSDGPLPVYGGDDRIQALTHKLSHHHSLQIGELAVRVHSTPCHTAGHVIYEVTDPRNSTAPAALFTGDTLFVAGCGRFFEGTAEQMERALCQVIGSFPDNTQVFCGHEYTVTNLRFAQTIEPNNPFIKQKLEWAEQQRKAGLSTIPSTVGEEKQMNPFIRVHEPAIAQALGQSLSPIQLMQELRDRKNKF